MKLKPVKTEFGWEIADETDTLITNPSEAAPTRAMAMMAIRQMEYESRSWDKRGLADAPHMDNF